MTKTKATLTIKGEARSTTAEEVLDEALNAAYDAEGGHIVMCRGGFLCQADPEIDECPWCLRIAGDDEREAEEILREAQRPVRH